MSNTTYKTTRKYKCPYCEFKDTRSNIVDHVDKKHQELMPEGYTAARAVYDYVNGKNYNTCMICHKKVYTWNDKINRYNNLCDNPECRKKVREIALARHMKVYNKPTLLNDPEQQEKMLANRKISGTYTFTDGGKMTYTGTYEKNTLEFMDKVLEIPSKDIQAPGPVLEYEYKGKIHKWITDIYYIPGNLLIEVKDGGSNPNNRPMASYREKQIAKEVMVTKLGIFNYIRLTNNDFVQLLDIFADMKMESLYNDNPKVSIHINEEVGGLPPHMPPEAYIVPYGMNNAFDGFAYSDFTDDNNIIIPDGDEFTTITKEAFKNKYTQGSRIYYTGADIAGKILSIRESVKTDKANPMYFASKISGKNIRKFNDILLCNNIEYFSIQEQRKICRLLESGAMKFIENYDSCNSNVVDTVDNVMICTSPNGYYAQTPDNFRMASDYYSNIEDLKSSGIIEFMNNIYISNYKKGGAM